MRWSATPRIAALGACLVAIAAGCGAVFGVDFDKAHAREDAASAEPDESGAPETDANEEDAGAHADGPACASAAKLKGFADLPKVRYRSVFAYSRRRALIVGDEKVIDVVDDHFEVSTFIGVDLQGAWENEDVAYVVGTFKGSNDGVIHVRRKGDDAWQQVGVVHHALHAVWGSGDFRVVTGSDGVVYYGEEPDPFVAGVQLDPLKGALATDPHAPVLSSIGGNSPRSVVAAGGPGGFYRFDGTKWKGEVVHGDATRSYTSAWGRSADAIDVFLGGNYELVVRYPNFDAGADASLDGASIELWHEDRSSPATAGHFINAIWGDDADHLIAVGTTGRFLVTDANGKLIACQTPAGANDLWGVSGTSFDDVWVVGDNGVVLRGPISRP